MGRFKIGCLLLCVFCGSANAWWADEHRVVAIIADKHLSDQVRIEVRRILGDVSLEEVANWADSIKSQSRWKHSRSWHYINLGSDQNIADYQSVVGGDILWALNYFYSQLQAAGTSPADRRQALQFFVHLVADIHQPLHVGKAIDAGGNQVSVVWKNDSRLSNLHRVWDGLLTDSDLTPQQYAKLIDRSSEAERGRWRDSSFKDWVEESAELHKNAYNFGTKNKGKKPIQLGASYQVANKSIAEKRMLQAAIRLAHYLNQVFE